MGPPDEATLDDWREAFARENSTHMALRRDLTALEQKMREQYPLDRPIPGWQVKYWADDIAAILKAHEPPR